MKEKNYKVPETIYRTTRDNSAHMMIHETRWYHSDEVFSLVEEEDSVYYESVEGKRVLMNYVTDTWSKENIFAYFENLFRNNDSFFEL